MNSWASEALFSTVQSEGNAERLRKRGRESFCFTLTAADPDWVKAGETTNRMFVTFKAPKGADYITALWQGCKFGAGAKDENDLIAKIWNGGFATQKVTTTGGNPMTYYKDWGLEAYNYAGLIAQKDGICDGWADYFSHVLQVQGLTNSKTMKIQANASAPRPNLLVNNWQVQANVKANQTTFVSILDPNGKRGPQDMRAQKVNGVWKYTFTKTEVNYTGGDAQNNKNPLATFGAHVVVQITMKGADGKTKVVIYDPSYGEKYDGHEKLNDNLLDFQKKALFGFFVVKGNRMVIDKVGDKLQLQIIPYTPKG